MKKQEYLDALEKIKAQIKEKNEAINQLIANYIESNKPCEIETLVKITRESGRVTIGNVKSFGIFSDRNVYVNAIKPEKGAQQYISQPYKSIEIL
jgi:uncharacterized protein YpmS